MKLFQYQEQVGGIPSSLAPERTTPDKWQPNTNTPQANWHAAKVAALAVVVVAPVLAFANPARAERSTPDKWQPESNKPTWDVKRQQHSFPSLFFNPISLPNPETLTVDKWQPETNKPLFDTKRQQQTYLFSVIDAKQLTQVEQLKIFSPETLVLTFPRTTQYQALTYPSAGFSAKERITPDKWQGETNRPTLGPKSLTHLIPVGQVVNVPSEIVTLDKWNRDTEKPTSDAKRLQYLGPSFSIDPSQLTQKERVSSDKWQPNTNQPVFDVRRQQHSYPFSFFYPEPKEVTDFETPSEFARSIDKIFDVPRNQYLYQSLAIDAKQLTLNERSSVDKWVPETSKPSFDIKRQQHTYPFVFFHPEPQEVTQFESPNEFARNVDRVFDRIQNQYLYPNVFIDPFVLTQRERSTPDKWQPASNQPLFDLKRQQFSYPSFVIDPSALTTRENVSLDKWVLDTNRPRFDVLRWQSTYPSSFFNPLPQPKTVTVDEWFTQPASPFSNPGRISFDQNGVIFISENVTLDRWFQETQRPFPIRIGVIDTELGPIVVQETITTDKWFQLTAQPLFPTQKLMSGETVLIQIPVQQVDLASWYRPTEQPIFTQKQVIDFIAQTLRRLKTHYTDKYTHRNTSFSDKFTTRNTLYSDKFSKRNSSYSDKYTKRNSNYSDKYTERGTDYQNKYPDA